MTYNKTRITSLAIGLNAFKCIPELNVYSKLHSICLWSSSNQNLVSKQTL